MAVAAPVAMPKANKEIIKAQKGTYEVVKPIGTGTFGAVYKVKRESDNKIFAMKCESLKLKRSILRQASAVLGALQITSPHFYEIEERGTVPNRFLFIIIPLLGKNLHDLRDEVQNKMYSIPTALHLAEQTLAAIRDLHRNGFIHRDIKPSHFCIGLEDESRHHTVFMLDFGLAKRPNRPGVENKPEDEEEAKLRRGAIHYRGSVRYASLRAHQSKELGFRDDMESWWFMTLEFITGVLPWALLAKQSEQEVTVLKTNCMKESSIGKLVLMPGAAQPVYEMLSSIQAVKQPYDLCDYDALWQNIEDIFRKTKSNRKTPPDWDCLSDYIGPEYQLGLAANRVGDMMPEPVAEAEPNCGVDSKEKPEGGGSSEPDKKQKKKATPKRKDASSEDANLKKSSLSPVKPKKK